MTSFGCSSASFILYGVCHLFIIFRRVKKLESATLAFAEGDLSSRAETSSGIAIGSLNKSFNLMADRIHRLIESNRSLTNAWPLMNCARRYSVSNGKLKCSKTRHPTKLSKTPGKYCRRYRRDGKDGRLRAIMLRQTG